MASKKSSKSRKSIAQQPVAQLPANYSELLADLKSRIRAAQVKAALSVNQELIQLYWSIGESIVQRQVQAGWGKAVVERLSDDLRKEFPDMTGFSTSNIWRMRAFYLAWTREFLAQPVRENGATPELAQAVRELDGQSLPQAVAQIPWGHNLALLEKTKDPAERLWYARQTSEHGWSRAVLVHQMESNLYARQGSATTNFASTLPAPQSDLADQVVKDPYVFEFLGNLAADVSERQLERKLIHHIRDFLLELGKGFAFVGSQYHIEVDDQDFYLDLLFYHLHLRCYVVIDLKVEPFKPEFAGKMGFYVNAVDGLVRDPGHDQPTIGIVLCKEKSRVIVEYTLRDSNQPIGVSTYRLLPEPLQDELPAVETLENELRKVEEKE
jgi:predicted nuclease of restriction endonuclease-like (RecB) superfamily